MDRISPSDPDNLDAWQFLIKYEKHIRRMIRKLAHNDELVDEVWTNVVLERIQRIILLFPLRSNSEIGLYLFVKNNLMGYTYKYLQRKKVLNERQSALFLLEDDLTDKSNSKQYLDVDNKELVRDVLDSLPQQQAVILFMRYFENLTWHEIGDHLRIGRTTVMYHHDKAIKAAQEHLKSKGLL